MSVLCRVAKSTGMSLGIILSYITSTGVTKLSRIKYLWEKTSSSFRGGEFGRLRADLDSIEINNFFL